ncbi:MAG: M24 family metallopeptidase, partial [Dehalococcoidia bacterium]
MAKPAHERDLVGRHVVDFDERVDVPRLKRERLARVQAEIAKADLGGILLYDPVNIRYATGTRNSGVFALRALRRHALIPREGTPILFDELSPKASDESAMPRKEQHFWEFFPCGISGQEAVVRWAVNMKGVLCELGIEEERLGIDHLDAMGFEAAKAQGIRLVDGRIPMERARSIKTVDELTLMRQAAAVADVAICEVRDAIRPGVTEDELYSVLAAANHRYGGEHTDGKLLRIGGNTNPWFSDSSDRMARPGDLVAFDIDMAGPMGYFLCVSRTYLCGDGKPSAEQREAYKVAYDFIYETLPLLRPGMAFQEIAERAYAVPEEYKAQRYSLMGHGAGMSDEWPALLHADWKRSGCGNDPGCLEENMVMVLEAYAGKVGGHEGVKLGEQMIITKDGPEI